MIPKNSRYRIDEWQVPAEYQLEKKLWDGTDIRISQRVGTDERMWVQDKLERMHVFGFLDETAFLARDKAAGQAITREDLNKLISDLPASEEDWKSVRKIPADREFLQRAIEATTPKRPRIASFFPVFMFLGVIAMMMGIVGIDAHSTTSLVVSSFALMLTGLVSVIAGFALGNISFGKAP